MGIYYLAAIVMDSVAMFGAIFLGAAIFAGFGLTELFVNETHKARLYAKIRPPTRAFAAAVAVYSFFFPLVFFCFSGVLSSSMYEPTVALGFLFCFSALIHLLIYQSRHKPLRERLIAIGSIALFTLMVSGGLAAMPPMVVNRWGIGMIPDALLIVNRDTCLLLAQQLPSVSCGTSKKAITNFLVRGLSIRSRLGGTYVLTDHLDRKKATFNLEATGDDVSQVLRPIHSNRREVASGITVTPL